MQKQIIDFLQSQHLLSLCVEGPYAASCFYVFDQTNLSLIFASSKETFHMRQILKNSRVSGTIALCEKKIHKIQGVQFIGDVREAAQSERKQYFQAFPVAKAIESSYWAIDLVWVKMTDNTLGFKTKIVWGVNPFEQDGL